MTTAGPIRPALLVAGGTAAVVATTTAVAFAGWRILRHLDAVEVNGRSMAPTLEPGDRLLVENWTYGRRPPVVGEVVVAPDPREPTRELIKRVAAVEDDQVTLRGDSAKSTDSRRFGSIPLKDVRGRVALRYWPPQRAGLIPASDVEMDPLTD